MSDFDAEAPLDLRALGEVESPEVVSDALRRFRRRTLIRTLWVVPVIAIVVGLRVAGPWKPTLADRIHDAGGVQVGAVYEAGEATVILERVADLGKTAGLAFVVADPAASNFDAVSLQSNAPLSEVRFDGEGRSTVVDFGMRVPASGRMTFTVVRSVCPPQGGLCPQNELGSFVVDLSALRVPRSLWT
jgi:hypothetical protein